MMFYFGVQSPAHKGHYIYRPNFYTVRFDGHEFNQTLTRMLDGGFLNLHRIPDRPGQGVWFPVADMLILTWWDRSGDSCGASNSAIIRPYSDTDERAVGWTQFVEEAQAAFPTIFARQTVRIVDNRNPGHRFIDPPAPAPAVAE